MPVILRYLGMPVILRYLGMPVILRYLGMPVILRGLDKTQFMTMLSILGNYAHKSS